MVASPPSRATAPVAAVLGALLLGACAVVLPGRAGNGQPWVRDVGAEAIRIVGATDDPVDVGVRNALGDLQDYWTGQFPDVFGGSFLPLQGGYFSVDPDDVDPSLYPQGIGCGQDPRAVENNAFYCASPQLPNSDSISYDRSFLGELADQYGRFLPDLVTAHEFGHAIQARVGSPGSSIATETQADCYAGAWSGWVAAGDAAHTTLQPEELDELLQGYLLLRDPVGTSPAASSAHGSGFDRVSAFQEGFDAGPTACRDDFGPDRVFTQGPFTSDADLLNRGNAPYAQLQQLMTRSLAEFWQQVFPGLTGSPFRTPAVEPFSSAPPCGDRGLDLVYCPDDQLVGYDEPDLTEPLYDRIGDFAVVTAVSVPYALAARDQLGLSADDGAAYRSAVCLSGWFGNQLVGNRLNSARVSPGDLDESVQFLLRYAGDPAVLPGVDLTGFQLVDRYRAGFVGGPRACDLGG
jgi:predicted metalloprotease